MIRKTAIAVLLVCCALLSGCAQDARDRFVTSDDPLDPYARLAPVILPDRRAEALANPGLMALDQGAATEATGEQIAPGVASGAIPCWYPQFLATAVIAVDRDRCAAAIDGWRSLETCGETVGWNGGYPAMAAMAIALDGDDYSLDGAAERLAALAGADRLIPRDWEAPVLVCLDYQAAALKMSGRNLEVILPREGTLTLTRGIACRTPLAFPADLPDRLLAQGCRLPDGRCDPALYPPAADYARARTLADPSHYNALAQSYVRVFRRQVLHTGLFRTADNVEHQLAPLAFVVLIILWTQFEGRRIRQKNIRQLLVPTAGLMAGWVLVRLFKYQLFTDELATRLLWYSYTVFQLGLAGLVLLSALSLGRPTAFETRPRPRWLWGGLAFLAALGALVMTNDRHQLIYAFYPVGGWGTHYTYGPLYPLVLGTLALAAAAAVAILVRKSLRGGRPAGAASTLVFSGLLALYTAAYILRVPLAQDSDLTMTFGIFILLYFETAIHSGLIPTNRHYADFLACAPLKLQLVDGDLVPRMATAAAEPLDRSVLEALAKASPVMADPDTLLESLAIPGGMAVWQEDIWPIRHLEAQLQAARQRLDATNALLARRYAAGYAQEAPRAKAAILTRLEQALGRSMDAVARRIAGMAEAPSPSLEMAAITLDLCFIKRKCSLFFRAQTGEAVPAGEARQLFTELGDLAAFCQIPVAPSFAFTGDLPVQGMADLYDFYHAVLDAAMGSASPILLQLVQAGPSENLERDCTALETALKRDLEKAPGDNPGNDPEKPSDASGFTLTLLLAPGAVPRDFPPADLATSLEAAGARFRRQPLEGLESLTLTVEGGGPHD